MYQVNYILAWFPLSRTSRKLTDKGKLSNVIFVLQILLLVISISFIDARIKFSERTHHWNKLFLESAVFLFQKSISPVLKIKAGVPVMVQWETNLTSIYENIGSIPGLSQWVKDLVLPWCTSQMWLGCHVAVAVAVAVASSHSSDSTPSLGTSICHTCGPIKTKQKHTSITNLSPGLLCGAT